MGLLNIIRRMHLREQLSIREISRRAGLSRNTIAKYLASNGRCCTSLRFEDSLGESSGLDGLDEQAASPRLPYHELARVQPCA